MTNLMFPYGRNNGRITKKNKNKIIGQENWHPSSFYNFETCQSVELEGSYENACVKMMLQQIWLDYQGKKRIFR